MNQKTKRLTQLSLVTLIFVSAACQGHEMQDSDEVKDVKSQNAGETSQYTKPAEISMDQQIKGAVKDLVARIGVSEDAIKVREVRSVQWGSGAMGCPKPGMNYTQAIVPGVLVFLDVDDKIYRYQGRTGRSLFYCPNDQAQAPAYGWGEVVM